ncbi:hypothetical protein AKJ09_11233 [Labilithrix luteola]|uniref:Lipoprotein n=1 Tax=Labilithrix luteola TaxID=1391654 RepID=A0A0K1QGK8_9BACT|nr:hypothetical protein AKJ09_11233 [Labilithrix luteola]
MLYVVMAACGASDRAAGLAASNDDGGGGGSVDASEIVDAFVDSMTNPVGDAKADPLPPDVATEKCDKILKYGGVTDYYVAEHAYPGKTAAELALVHFTITAPNYLEGYSLQFGSGGYVRDGSVAVMCDMVNGTPSTKTVTFVLPR